MPTVSEPVSNHVQSCWPTWRDSASRPSSAKNSTRLSTKDRAAMAVPRRWPCLSAAALSEAGRNGATPSSRIAPSTGSAMTSQSRSNTPPAPMSGATTGAWAPSSAIGRPAARTEWDNRFTSAPSVLQQAGVVDRGRASRAEDGHDDREPDDDLGGSHHHHEEGGDLAVEVAVLLGEGDQREVGRVEHQLDAHEHHDGVAAGQHPDAADREQDPREGDVGHHVVHSWSPPVAGASSVVDAGTEPSRPACGAQPSCSSICSIASASAGADRTVPRAVSTRETDVGAAVPSGSSAGVSTALWRA